MSKTHRAARSALVVAGMMSLVSASSALAQRAEKRYGFGAPPAAPSQPTTPYPGATVTIDPRWYQMQRVSAAGHRQQQRYPQYPTAYYAPAPVYYPSGAGTVYDTNGRPLYSGYEAAPSAVNNDFPVATPDLTGSPYVVIEGGTMIVDFGNGDRRAVPSCAAVEQVSTPDGQPRTLFYRPPAYGLVLRQGQRGQVLGQPTAGARVCYTSDAYGRVVLDY